MADNRDLMPAWQVKQELKHLRQGPALAHPAAVLNLSEPLRVRLAGRADADLAEHVLQVVSSLRRAVSGLGQHERLYAEVDFNLAAEHTYPTLTERQESLAAFLRCTSKTVRRRADKTLDTLALLLMTGDPRALTGQVPVHSQPWISGPPGPGPAAGAEDDLSQLWCTAAGTRIDIVCSEIPPGERPAFASPHDRNYLRYAKFADLDSLIYVKTHLSRMFPEATIRDFSPSEYLDTNADRLVVIGGPPWNAKYREFMSSLPYYFEPHPLGEDDPLVIPILGGLTIGPRWTSRGELLEDIAVFTRLTLAQGTAAFLLAGCLTLGVLGAAKCFLWPERGSRNASYITGLVGSRDFVLVTEARRIGGIVDMADLTMRDPLLLLARQDNEQFTVVTDNTKGHVVPRDRPR